MIKNIRLKNQYIGNIPVSRAYRGDTPVPINLFTFGSIDLTLDNEFTTCLTTQTNSEVSITLGSQCTTTGLLVDSPLDMTKALDKDLCIKVSSNFLINVDLVVEIFNSSFDSVSYSATKSNILSTENVVMSIINGVPEQIFNDVIAVTIQNINNYPVIPVLNVYSINYQ